MYKSFRIRNFRCFSELEIANLQRVNLITGLNNVGKTALLEAIWLHCGRYKPELMTSLNAFRGVETYRLEDSPGAETLWDSFFGGFDSSNPAELRATEVDGKEHTIRLKVLKDQDELSRLRNSAAAHGEKNVTQRIPLASGPAQVLELHSEDNRKRQRNYYMIFDSKGLRTEPIPPPVEFQAVFLASRIRAQLLDEADLFSKLEVTGKQQVVVDALQVVEPRLKRLALVKSGGQTMIHGDVGLSRLVPLNFMGEGTMRLAIIVLYICTSPKGVVLVDEIENGFHYSILPKLWQVVAQTARQWDTQVFATTHSLECVNSAHQAFVESENYDFRLYRLERVKDDIRAISYDRDALSAAMEAGLEVR